MYRTQLDQVERNTADVAARAEQILEKHRRGILAATPTPPRAAFE